MTRTALFSLAFALAASAGAAHAQTAPPAQDEQGIVVTGQKEVPPAVARRYVSGISSAIDGQLARFVDPVCPMVIGLPDEYADVVARRVRDAAVEAGADVPKNPKCAPNIIVIVANDADALVKQMRKEFPGMFAGLGDAQLRRALRDGPVHVWNTAVIQNEDGIGSKSTGIDRVGNSGAPVLQIKSASNINLSTQQAVVQSVVVLDSKALIDKSLAQIGDYVAMRTLAGARPPRNGTEADTILSLFDEGAIAPPGMTMIDRSYVAGIYRMRSTGKAISQRSTISSQITRESRERSGTKN